MDLENTQGAESDWVTVSIADGPFLIVLESRVVGEPGRIIPIDGEMTIGRGDTEVTFNDPALSKRHARFDYANGVCQVRDLNSRNGTRVNGARVSVHELQSGDHIRIGAIVLQYQDRATIQTHQVVLGTLCDSGVAMWKYFPDAKEFVFSEHAEQALELPRQSLGRPRTPLLRCVHPDDQERVLATLAAAQADGAVVEIEVRLKLALVERWVTLRGRRSPQHEAIAGTIVNITGTKRREATLSRTALMFEGFADGVVLTAEDSSIVDVNPAFARSFGVSRGDALSRSVFAVVPVVDASRQLEEIREVVARDGRWSGTLTVPSGPDQIFAVHVFSLLTDRGECAGTAWVFHDVTERSRLHAQVAFLDRLASLGTMSAGVAHEINNPLMLVLANAQFMRDRVTDRDAIEACDDIVQGAQRIGKIVEGLRKFARSNEDVESVPTDLRSAVELAIRFSRSMARADIDITTAFESTNYASAVESQLVQVLVNLLSNAIQSFAADATSPAVTVRVVDEPDGVAISVIDNGAGMAPDVLARAFDPFFTTRALHGGTGLGLSICHGLVTGMAGTITLRSVVGSGTTARVVLPRARRPESTREASREVRVAEPKLRVLVIDDEPLLLKTVKRMLSDQKEVVTASGFTEAVRVLLEERASFDVILCDLMMPDGSGMQLHARLLAERPEIVDRMVFFTGAAFTDEAQHFFDTVANRPLLKPVDRATLRQTLFETAAKAVRRLPGS